MNYSTQYEIDGGGAKQNNVFCFLVNNILIIDFLSGFLDELVYVNAREAEGTFKSLDWNNIQLVSFTVYSNSLSIFSYFSSKDPRR